MRQSWPLQIEVRSSTKVSNVYEDILASLNLRPHSKYNSFYMALDKIHLDNYLLKWSFIKEDVLSCKKLILNGINLKVSNGYRYHACNNWFVASNFHLVKLTQIEFSPVKWKPNFISRKAACPMIMDIKKDSFCCHSNNLSVFGIFSKILPFKKNLNQMGKNVLVQPRSV